MITSYPALAHAAQRWTPIRPVPPITEMEGKSFLGRYGGLGAHGPSDAVALLMTISILLTMKMKIIISSFFVSEV